MSNLGLLYPQFAPRTLTSLSTDRFGFCGCKLFFTPCFRFPLLSVRNFHPSIIHIVTRTRFRPFLSIDLFCVCIFCTRETSPTDPPSILHSFGPLPTSPLTGSDYYRSGATCHHPYSDMEPSTGGLMEICEWITHGNMQMDHDQ